MLSKGSLSSYQVFDLSTITVLVVGGIAGLLYLLRRRIQGAVYLRVDDVGFELVYPNGRLDARAWSDPSLSFELIDFTNLDPSRLPTSDFPYSIRIRGVQSLLTEEAYQAMMANILLHKLQDSADRGKGWIYPAGSTPIVHKVRSSFSST